MQWYLIACFMPVSFVCGIAFVGVFPVILWALGFMDMAGKSTRPAWWTRLFGDNE